MCSNGSRSTPHPGSPSSRRVCGSNTSRIIRCAPTCTVSPANQLRRPGTGYRISTDHDPLFRFHRWLANLRILEVEEIKTVPYAPMSHPFIERLIGTIRREYLDHTFFWNSIDLHRKLENFRTYYNPSSYCLTSLCH